MTRSARILTFNVAAALYIGIAVGARAADTTQPMILVASSVLDGTPYAQTVVLATPMPNGGHIGVVINRPTPVKLETLFPEHAPSRKVVDPVYAGGPFLAKNIIAVTRQAPEHSGGAIPLMPGVSAVLDAPTVDRIIETTPNAARFFIGLVAWEAAELENELRLNAWEVHPADAEVVFSPATGLWNALRRPMASAPHAALAG